MFPNPESVFPTSATWPVDNFKFLEVNAQAKPNFTAVSIEPGIRVDCSGGDSIFTVSMDALGTDVNPRNVKVYLYLKDTATNVATQVASQTIQLTPGETKAVTMNWTKPSSIGKGLYTLEARINIPQDASLGEVNITDNIKSATISLLCQTVIPACTANELSSNWQVMRDVNDKYIEDQ
ncbi:hypothetical protein [Aneurinibacillus danicus]|jgi:hypothetical protein|uniref:Uncharacterized protein n=1 Tax=Aneurinibacillus danicus TaxID=267746 RepID=A0A511VBS4_9BACL|nr:hypothetical protein [Aneurinibacillus danicus]GEN35801.1 hypothetical protein ADA01nite_32610 [Aneurinibacillus danicus]